MTKSHWGGIYLVLPAPVADALVVAHPGEGDGRVQGHPQPGQQEVEQVVQLLPQEEGRLGHQVPHLHVVVHGQVAHGLGVGGPVAGVFTEGRQPVAGVPVQEAVQDEHVLHPLTKQVIIGIPFFVFQPLLRSLVGLALAKGQHVSKFGHALLSFLGSHQLATKYPIT